MRHNYISPAILSSKDSKQAVFFSSVRKYSFMRSDDDDGVFSHQLSDN
jgi:hypothetical protein